MKGSITVEFSKFERIWILEEIEDIFNHYSERKDSEHYEDRDVTRIFRQLTELSYILRNKV